MEFLGYEAKEVINHIQTKNNLFLTASQPNLRILKSRDWTYDRAFFKLEKHPRFAKKI